MNVEEILKLIEPSCFLVMMQIKGRVETASTIARIGSVLAEAVQVLTMRNLASSRPKKRGTTVLGGSSSRRDTPNRNLPILPPILFVSLTRPKSLLAPLSPHLGIRHVSTA